MRLIRIPAGATVRLVRGYAASAPKPEPEHDVEPQAESSTAAQRRLWPAPPVEKPAKPTKSGRLTLKSDPDTAVKPKRRRSPNALALIRAQKLAQAIQELEPPSGVNIPLPDTSAALKAAQQQQVGPTLEDLESKRPVDGPPPIMSKRYPKRYKRLYDELDNAFVARQLLKLAREVGVKIPRGRGKGLAIKGIMQVWGWDQPIPPEEVERNKREVGLVRERDWELRKGELWLMMRDGESLRPIMEQGIRFSIPPPASRMEDGEAAKATREGWRLLRASGTEASLLEMDTLINERREAIEQCTRDVDHVDPSPTVSSLLGVISNAANVYLERQSVDKVRISGLNAESVSKAELLLRQAALHETTRASISRSLMVPSTEYDMALYPHLPSPTGSIPWQDLGSASRPLFRLRGVQPWEPKVGHRETAHVDQNMEDLPFIPLGTGGGESTTATEGFKTTRQKGEIDGGGVVVRFGHVLYAKSGSEGGPLSSPVSKRLMPGDVASALAATDVPPIFIPCLPPSLIHFPLESKTSRSRQLTYRAEDGRVLEITQPLPRVVEEIAEDVNVKGESGWHKELDDMLDKLEIDSVEEQDQDEVAIPSPAADLSLPPRVRILRQETKEIAMPDRPIDLSLMIWTSDNDLSTDETASIPQVLDYLNNPPNLPPPSINLKNETWSLVSALELDITESEIQSSSDLGMELDMPQSAVRVRTVKSTDLTFAGGRAIHYAELECDGELSATFWKELARLSRVVAPGAGILRTEIY